MKESKVTLAIHLEIGVRRDGDEYVAWCIPLDVSSQGRSKAEAVTSLKEAVELWFESCLQRGVLDKALREVGFTQGRSPAAPTNGVRPDAHSAEFTPDYIEVSVPAYIAARHLETRAPR